MFSSSIQGYLEIILRASAVYFFMLFAIRIFGKKELSQLSTSDLVLILLISNAVQNAMVGPDNSLGGGLIAALVLFCINYGFKLVMFKNKKATELIEGNTAILIYKGVVNEDIIKKEKITPEELEAVVREHGVLSSAEVEIAVLERDGNISVVSQELRGQTFHMRGRKLHPKHQKAN
jgi:uncharacterized membrane protein YcaP (DUF421 family)